MFGFIKKMLKSKTLHFNAWIPVAIAVCAALDIKISSEEWTAIGIVGNIALRFITNGPVSAK